MTLKRVFLPLLIACCLCICLPSCIMEDGVPCTVQISLGVKDKNYSNVNNMEYEDAVAEDAPFRQYVHSLHVAVFDSEGKAMVSKTIDNIASDEQVLTVDFQKCLPFGTYEIVAWGNLDGDISPLGNDVHTLDFHPANKPGGDIYLAAQTFDYQGHPTPHYLEMERTQGKVIILTENLPEEYSQVKTHIEGLYSSVDTRWNYTGTTHVDHSEYWTLPGKLGQCLSPTADAAGGRLQTKFINPIDYRGDVYDVDIFGKSLNPPDVTVPVKRNTLTAVKYIWHPDQEDFSVSVKINDAWLEVHQMEFDTPYGSR